MSLEWKELVDGGKWPVVETKAQLTLHVQDWTVSTVLDAEMVSNTPLNGRSSQALIWLTPRLVTRQAYAETT